MRTSAAAKETFFAPESPQAGQIFNFIEAHAERRGFTPEPRFFLSGGEIGDQVEIPHEIYEVLVKAVQAMRSGLADLIDNHKASVDAKCVDPLVAGKRLTSIINTGLKY